MTEEKQRRVTVAATVAAVVLLFVVLVVLLFQIVYISVKKNEIRKIDEEIAIYERMVADGEDELELNKQRWVIEQKARALGYKYKYEVTLPWE